MMASKSNGKESKEYEVKDHQLYISRLGSWYKLWKQNKIDPSGRSMAARITMVTFATQPFQWLQRVLYYQRLRKVDFTDKAPVFVIGHWRSGTTHLHYVLSRDKRFGYLSNYQSLFMNVAFIGGGLMKWVLDRAMPETRPQDNIKMSADEPAEEEQPLCNNSVCSGMQTFFFPKNESYYEKYNLFKGIKPLEKRHWRYNYMKILRLISVYNDNKPLLLKNPHNTSRVKELLELFPDAKFVYIHRNPFDVYRSTQTLYNKMLKTQFMQDVTDDEIENRIFYWYRTTLGKYLDERYMIPEGNLIEVSYKELDDQPKETIEKIYKDLDLWDYQVARPDIEEYLGTIADYQKNSKNVLEKRIYDRIVDEWAFAFKEWGYAAKQEVRASK